MKAALKALAQSSKEPKLSKVDATGEASASLTPELVIALCGPIGSPLHDAANQVSSILDEFGYRTEKIRLSQLIKLNSITVDQSVDSENRYKELGSLITVGDELRRKFGNDVLAKLAIAKISADREKQFGKFSDAARENLKESTEKIGSQRICHVIDSVKNSAELDLLRLIYGQSLFAIGVFSPLEVRKSNLEQPGAFTKAEIESLIDTDSGEEFSHGQSVRNTFPKCDFFLRVDFGAIGFQEDRAASQILEKLRRFFSLIFRTSVVTPTADEAAMYAAASAARNSACLSRQVGAAVTSAYGEVLAIGWNDVPQYGGGLYGKPPLNASPVSTPSLVSTPDKRCFALGGSKCFNDEEKRGIAKKVVGLLVNACLLQPSNEAKAVEVITADSRIKDLIEFSRAVHAEMHAILGAARTAGDKLVGGKIYVTTYPCHSCARHIIASGLAEVQFIEPYRKSMATKLHSDAISESVSDTNRVRLLQFDGVAPRRFIDLFEANDRKKNGVLRLQPRANARPATQVSLKAIPRLEEVVVAEVQEHQLKLPALQEAEDIRYEEEAGGTTPAA